MGAYAAGDDGRPWPLDSLAAMVKRSTTFVCVWCVARGRTADGQ